MSRIRALALASFIVWTVSSIRRPNTRLSAYGTPSRLLARFQAALFSAGEERSALREIASAIVLLGSARAAAVLFRQALSVLGQLFLGGGGGGGGGSGTLGFPSQKGLLNAGFRLASMIPGVSTIISWEVGKELDKIELGMLGDGDPSALTALPKRARRAAAIVAEARGLVADRNASWAPGEASKKWGGIYYKWQDEEEGCEEETREPKGAERGGEPREGTREEEGDEDEDEEEGGLVVVRTPSRSSALLSASAAAAAAPTPSAAAAEAAALHELQAEMMSTFNSTNLLYPAIFPAARKFEAEVVAMAVSLLRGDEARPAPALVRDAIAALDGLGTGSAAAKAAGLLTSGGTESILICVLAYRELARARGIGQLGSSNGPAEIVAANTAHPAIHKACHYFGLRLVVVAPDAATQRLTPEQVRPALTNRTVAVYASAPTFPHGVVDDVEGLGRLCSSRGLGLHVDNCLGGVWLSFENKNRTVAAGKEEKKNKKMKKMGVSRAAGSTPRAAAAAAAAVVGGAGRGKNDVPIPFDFSVPGVSSMSMDVHKYGMASKGVSVAVLAPVSVMASRVRKRRVQGSGENAWRR